MIHHRCSACGHWMESSDHLIGMAVPCRECGEPVAVPGRSAPNVPRATQPSQALRPVSVQSDAPSEPEDEGPVEAGWHRLQNTTVRMLPKTGHALFFVVAAVIACGMIVGGLLAWWWMVH